AQHTVARTTVGLYDDPDAGDNLHNDPLLHTATELNGDSESDNDTHRARVLRTSANSQHRQFQVPTPLEYEAPPSAAQLYRDSHTEWFGRLVLLLVAVLHAKHRVSFRACALILFTLNTILIALNVLQPTNPLPITLHTIINRFDLQDRFTIYPICGSCHRIFPIDAPIDTLCSDCDSRLFKPISDRLFRRLTGRQSQRPPPICAAPIQLPSSLLADFLTRGDNEESCSSWKSRSTVPGELKDISDGDIWKTINGPDTRPFFLDPQDDGELRIGVTMSLDWCAYLILSRSKYSYPFSSQVRSYRAENLLVSFMTPGPKEPTGSQLQNYMRLVVDDLLQLYDEGIIYHTPAYPQGK
ncbi:hypothetical protein DEU56DRAFT_704327, partial [Suillus clintonianus]|uniref:uncharacterized protein n=1 Tax=Suillus clintonianus TaxID=1904413 RepID=UPI001B874109